MTFSNLAHNRLRMASPTSQNGMAVGSTIEERCGDPHDIKRSAIDI